MSNRQIPVLYETKNDCCGCTACYAVCPQRAIRIIMDNEGFEYPQIDEYLCIGCKLCLKVCPFKN